MQATRLLKSKKFAQFSFDRNLVQTMLADNQRAAEEICVPLEPHKLNEVEVKIFYQVLAEQVTSYFTDKENNERWLSRIEEIWAGVSGYPVPENATFPSCLGRLVPVVRKEHWLSDLAELVRGKVITNVQSVDTLKTN